MKKINGFALLDMIIVITIIGIVATSLFRLQRNIPNRNDKGREAVNIIYKEMNQYIKDFQRNKIREDGSGNEHEIQYFYLIFNNTNNNTTITGNNLTIGNMYLYSGDNGGTTGHYDGITLISGQKYTALQTIKGSKNYIFYTRNKNTGDVASVLISNNGKIYTGDFYNEDNFGITTNLTDQYTYEFLICGGNGTIKPIGVISINAISKATNLERCKSERYSGIICNDFASCD